MEALSLVERIRACQIFGCPQGYVVIGASPRVGPLPITETGGVCSCGLRQTAGRETVLRVVASLSEPLGWALCIEVSNEETELPLTTSVSPSNVSRMGGREGEPCAKTLFSVG